MMAIAAIKQLMASQMICPDISRVMTGPKEVRMSKGRADERTE
jgi:hypothetical protein